MIAALALGRGASSLQAALSSASTVTAQEPVEPHHPITCAGELRYEGDGTFACAHVEVPPDDLRTQHCLDHSVALLLIELSEQL